MSGLPNQESRSLPTARGSGEFTGAGAATCSPASSAVSEPCVAQEAPAGQEGHDDSRPSPSQQHSRDLMVCSPITVGADAWCRDMSCMAGECAAGRDACSCAVGVVRLAAVTACVRLPAVSWHICAATGEKASRLVARAIDTPTQNRAAIALDLLRFRVASDAG